VLKDLRRLQKYVFLRIALGEAGLIVIEKVFDPEKDSIPR
jgi:hypothetical protein